MNIIEVFGFWACRSSSSLYRNTAVRFVVTRPSPFTPFLPFSFFLPLSHASPFIFHCPSDFLLPAFLFFVIPSCFIRAIRLIPIPLPPFTFFWLPFLPFPFLHVLYGGIDGMSMAMLPDLQQRLAAVFVKVLGLDCCMWLQQIDLHYWFVIYLIFFCGSEKQLGPYSNRPTGSHANI